MKVIKKRWLNMNSRERMMFVRIFNGRSEGDAHITTTNRDDVEKLDYHTGGMTLFIKKGEPWIRPVFCGGFATNGMTRTQINRKWTRLVQAHDRDPANRPFKLDVRNLIATLHYEGTK